MNFSYPPCVPHACPSHSPGFEHPKDAWSSSFCIFLYPSVNSSFNANASSWTHYSRIPLACSYLCVSNQGSPPYNGTNKITVQIRRREAGESHLLNASDLHYSPVAPYCLKTLSLSCEHELRSILKTTNMRRYFTKCSYQDVGSPVTIYIRKAA